MLIPQTSLFDGRQFKDFVDQVYEGPLLKFMSEVIDPLLMEYGTPIHMAKELRNLSDLLECSISKIYNFFRDSILICNDLLIRMLRFYLCIPSVKNITE